MLKTIELNKLKFNIRKDTNDAKMIEDEVIKDCYEVPVNAKTVIDIGAHIGGTSILCASKGATVYSFEPENNNYTLLLENIRLNGLEDKIIASQLGVSDKFSKEKLNLHEKNSGLHNSYGLFEVGNNYQFFKTVSLPAIFYKYDIEDCDFLKLDCEGSEYEILKSLSEDLITKIKQISMEFHRGDNKQHEVLFYLSSFYKIKQKRRHEFVLIRKDVYENISRSSS